MTKSVILAVKVLSIFAKGGGVLGETPANDRILATSN
jgi:hypothetical protein